MFSFGLVIKRCIVLREHCFLRLFSPADLVFVCEDARILQKGRETEKADGNYGFCHLQTKHCHMCVSVGLGGTAKVCEGASSHSLEPVVSRQIHVFENDPEKILRRSTVNSQLLDSLSLCQFIRSVWSNFGRYGWMMNSNALISAQWTHVNETLTRRTVICKLN